MLELVYRDKGREAVYPLEKGEITIGRSANADLCLPDNGVSRNHAKITLKSDSVSIRDLHSSNGTKVNDLLVTEAPLFPGDRITLGNTDLTLRERGTMSMRAVELKDVGRVSEDSGAIIRSPEALASILERAPIAADRVSALADIETSKKILRLLTQVATALVEQHNLEGLFNKVMDLVFENFSAERGVLGLYESDTLVPTVVRYRKPRPEGDQIIIPKAITNKVRNEKVSIMTMDAQSDESIGVSASIISGKIRSAMCVPLWDKDKVIGIIYVDEQIRSGMFRSDDLDLLGALANFAAVAIERARLTQKIQEEQATRARLERYHSPGVIETILKSGGSLDSLEMQERMVTVSFTDIVGFTPMSERLSPQEIGRAINECFTELTECIFEHEGTLDKYIGDCIMAVFGAPIPQEDHAVRCVSAVLDMHLAVERFNVGRDSAPLQLRTGINSGKVVAGDIGSPKRKDYSVLGDTVNMASRLEAQVAEPGWIVIGEATYNAVREHFECEYLGPMKLKGKSAEVGAYRVLREKATSTAPTLRPTPAEGIA
jgi:adenylate cyclase